MTTKIEDMTMEAQIFKEEIRELGGNVHDVLKKSRGDRMSVMRRPSLKLDTCTMATSQMMDFEQLNENMRMSSIERQKANLKGDYEELTDELERKYRQNLMKLAHSERLTEEERKAIVMMNSAYESNKIQLQEMEDHYEAGYQEKEELEVMFEKLEEEGDGLAKDIRDQKAVIEGQNRRVKELETENGKLQTELAKFKTSDDRGLSFFD